jgi:ATP-binding cassette subfamily B protein
MLFEPPVKGQKFFAPEVVQTSAMDCGPAALKCLLDGFGISASYPRLREACQTNVDGTSINTIEDIAVQLGLEAEQIMIPADHISLPESQSLPALVVVRLPNGLTHFLVIWGTLGNFIQLMDPATGRRWTTWKRFLNEIYIHTYPVPVDSWREWAGTTGMLAPLRRRMRDLRLDETHIDRLVAQAENDPSWFALAVLDAATRMTASIVSSGGFQAGPQAAKLLERFFAQNLAAGPAVFFSAQDSHPEFVSIPASYWSVRPIFNPEEDPLQADHLLLQGAVLIRVLGRRGESELDLGETAQPASAGEAARLPPELVAALTEPAYRPMRTVWNAMREDGLLTPTVLSLALLLSTFSVMIEALLFQGILQIGQSLSLVSQRVAAAAALLAFVLAGLLLEFPIAAITSRMGRRLETRLRVSLLEKIPNLNDRYFHSRLTSDMTQRAHDLRSLRGLPGLGIGLLRTSFQLILTTIGVIWLDPISAPIAILATVFFFGLSFLTNPLLDERDLRLRTHVGGLSRFYLDSLLGLIPARTHSAERALRRQHEGHMVEWVRSGRDYQRVVAIIQAAGTVLYSIFAVWLVVNYISKGGQAGEILLLFYWTLNLPVLGQGLAELIQQYPLQRNRVLRLLEPLSTPDEEATVQGGLSEPAVPRVPTSKHGMAIEFASVSVQAGGHTILRDISLALQPGEHVAIVGPSGAGKSSLIGLLLGWHRPASGHVAIDGMILDNQLQQSVRHDTAWIDPAVQLWNRSLYDNLRYGTSSAEAAPVNIAIETADLYDVLDKLPDGLKSVLGESGGLVSGGEGQRVRLGRAFLRPNVRLAILDEPFRGLDRAKRRQLLAAARRHWQDVTLLVVTHDLSETSLFPRVIVIEDGQIVEDAPPAELLTQPGSRYRSLYEAEKAVREDLWASADWRRLWLENGQLIPPPVDNP